MRITYLILNYETYWETINCVSSIIDCIGNLGKIRDRVLELEVTNDIVIVDNGSKNESLIKIKERYGNVANMHILHTEKNLGFACGNNVGFLYAKEKLDPDFIVMINSDILFDDKEFIRKVLAAYEQYNFAVAGPNVCLPNGKRLNPCYSKCITFDDANKVIKKSEYNIKLCEFKIEPIIAAFQKIKNKFCIKKSKAINTKTHQLRLEEGEQIHGCFIIFASDYINYFEGLYEKTFLYGEECLLRLRCMRSGLSMYYLNDISAIHNESRTEKYINMDINDRHLKRYRNVRNSYIEIRNYMSQENLK